MPDNPDDDDWLIEILPDSTPPRASVFTLHQSAGGPMSFQVSGAPPFKSHPIPGWKIDFGTLNVQMNDLGRYLAAYHQDENEAGRAAWQHTAQEIGAHLYDGLLNSDALLARQLTAARRRAIPPDGLRLAFAGPREFLSVPYELLHDRRAPLAVTHPIYRQITGLTPRRQQTLGDFVHQLRSQGEPLRVLLISSGVARLGADQEIADLHTRLRQAADQSGLRLDVERLRPRSQDDITQRLSHGIVHMIHYVGQVYHDRHDPEQSGLLFAGDERLGQWVFPLPELARRLQSQDTQFFYASACVGTQEWDQYVLRDQDYLDLFDRLTRAGVPYVLGFRWYVTEYNRQRFTALFYDHLWQDAQVEPEQAVFLARREIYRHDPQDETWALPLLIAPVMTRYQVL